jgi:hypothetical protein
MAIAIGERSPKPAVNDEDKGRPHLAALHDAGAAGHVKRLQRRVEVFQDGSGESRRMGLAASKPKRSAVDGACIASTDPTRFAERKLHSSASPSAWQGTEAHGKHRAA